MTTFYNVVYHSLTPFFICPFTTQRAIPIRIRDWAFFCSWFMRGIYLEYTSATCRISTNSCHSLSPFFLFGLITVINSTYSYFLCKYRIVTPSSIAIFPNLFKMLTIKTPNHSLAPHNLISLNFTVDLIPIKENSLTVPTMQFSRCWILNLISICVFVTLRTPQASYGRALSVDMICIINSSTTQP